MLVNAIKLKNGEERKWRILTVFKLFFLKILVKREIKNQEKNTQTKSILWGMIKVQERDECPSQNERSDTSEDATEERGRVKAKWLRQVDTSQLTHCVKWRCFLRNPTSLHWQYRKTE